MPPRVAAIVCTCDRVDLLPGCLETLRGATGAEIVVVDNSADPAAASAIRQPGFLPDEVSLVSSTPPGLSRARNRGVAATAADIVAFIDDDALAGPGWLAAIRAAFDAHPEAAVVGGPVAPIWPDRRPEWLDPTLDGFYSIVDRGPVARALDADEWLAGTNIAFRRDALLAAGGFDERLGRRPGTLLGNEEIALAVALRRAGHAVRYDPAIAVRHRIHPDRLSRAWLRRRVVWQAFSDLLLETVPPVIDAAGLWGEIGASLASQPPHWRGLPGLMRDLDSPADVRAQAAALGAVVRLLALSGESLSALLAA